MPHRSSHSLVIRITSMVLACIALLLTLWLHLLSALLAGLLVYALVQAIAPILERRIHGRRARVIIVAVLGTLLVGVLMMLVFGSVSFLRNTIGSPELLWHKQWMPLVEKARQQLPAIISAHLPDSADKLRQMAMHLTYKHAAGLQLIGAETARIWVHIIIGFILGGLIALNQARPAHHHGPLAEALMVRCDRLAKAFHHIVFAQVKIALVNTVFTGIFLLAVLPLCGIKVPLAKTLVMLSFVTGLLPVVGNLVSNTAVTIAALSVSLWVGVTALGFLVLIHKFEYFLNARIVGNRIHAHAWELLISMLIMQAAFGLAGLVAAPIYYACIKSELKAEKLI